MNTATKRDDADLKREHTVDLRDYLNVIRRFWRVVAATTAVGLIGAIALTVFSTSQYTATTRVFFTADGGKSGQDLAYAANFTQTRLQTYKGLAKTPSVLNAVRDQFGLKESTSKLADQVTVTTSQISTIIEVSVTDDSAKRAAALSNSVGASLIQAVAVLEKPSDSGAARIKGTVVGPATKPTSPSSPNLVFNLLVGLVVGLGIGLGAAGLRHALSEPSSPREA
jgi:capsular polysaccharide biosynthesis protein